MSGVIPFPDLPSWRAQMDSRGLRVVATNGCFDLLHVGHLRYLQAAAALGDCLLVGLNDDDGVRKLKGPGRPVHPAAERAELLAALRCVGAATVFPGSRAMGFLELARPTVYVKGGDYTRDSLHAPEREILERLGSEIVLLPLVPGRSTSAALQALKGTTP